MAKNVHTGGQPGQQGKGAQGRQANDVCLACLRGRGNSKHGAEDGASAACEKQGTPTPLAGWLASWPGGKWSQSV
jgi:hypothetical protein